ncbi:Acetyltransferase PA2271 [Golovinomyces cichoracearum]|uniref:Acetyltransferase PA2271 n=1 Tax=Golovinomyces cichoracearum TaxID=62708 RepID=A0A420IRA1_9PEZI|nr:Acetyltransferase PA2271 [Golovinomyces cichoracearum]
MDSLSILAMAAAQVQQQELSQSSESPHGESYSIDADDYTYTIRKGKNSDIPYLRHVELSAGNRYRAVGLDDVAENRILDPDRLASMADSNHLWVAVDKYGPIGFLCGEKLDGNFHIVEVSVSQEFQGKGIGKGLMTTMLEQITLERSFKSVTLTTYRSVSWNGPWCSRMGFGEVHPKLLGSAYDFILETEEEQYGFDRQERCLMMKDLFY